MKSSAYITIVIVAGLVLIGYLFATTPDTAPAQLPLILAGIGALVAVLNKQGDTDTKVEKSVEASKENAHSIAAVSQQTNTALESVAQKVNGHLTSLLEEIKALTAKVANLEKDKAVKQAEAVHAETATAQILTAIAAIPAAVVVEPPREPQAGPGTHQ